MSRKYIRNSDFTEVPTLPGVYSWYYPLIIFETDSFDSFYSRASYFLELSHLGETQGKSFTNQISKWRTWELTIKSKIKPDKALKNKWESIKSNKKLCKAIEESSIMFQPLYVGCAKDLSKRIKNHLDNTTGFSKTFTKACSDFKMNYPEEYYPWPSLELNRLHLSYTVLESKSEAEHFEDFLQTFTDPKLSKT